MISRLKLFFVFFLAGMVASTNLHADRLKDLTSIAGVRSNQLVGYGLDCALVVLRSPFHLPLLCLDLVQSLMRLAQGTLDFVQLPQKPFDFKILGRLSNRCGRVRVMHVLIFAQIRWFYGLHRALN